MAKGNGEGKYAYLDRLSTEQLEELLRADFESSECGDNGVIFHILEVIEKREEEHPTGCLPNKDKAWEEFQQYYNIPEGEGRSLYPTHGAEGTLAEGGKGGATSGRAQSNRLLRLRSMVKVAGIAAILVAVIFGTLITVQAAGIDVFGAIGRWTEETFHFVPSIHGEIQTTGTSSASANYTLLQAALDDCGITEKLVPGWYPNGCEMSELKVSSNGLGDNVFCAYSGPDSVYLNILVWRYDLASDLSLHVFEKDSSQVEQYTSAGKVFYILSNIDNSTATWSDAHSLVVSITGNISTDNIKAMIDSIGGASA